MKDQKGNTKRKGNTGWKNKERISKYKRIKKGMKKNVEECRTKEGKG